MGAGSAELHTIISNQYGVISRAQALVGGLTPAAIKTRLTNREWTVEHPGVYRLTDFPVCCESRIRAASLWAGKGAVIGGAAAVWWWGLTTEEPSAVAVLTLPHRNLRSRPHVPVSRRAIPAEDQTTHRQVRVVTLPFAALFGAVALGARGQQVLDRALLRSVPLQEAQQVLERNRGTHGARQAGRWLAAAADGTAAESERVFARLLRSVGITGWVVNRRHRFPGGPLVPDFRFDDLRIVVEIDGWAFHSDPDVFSSDRSRQNRIVIGGWSVLRFTWSQLHDQPGWVIDQLLALIASKLPG